MRLGLTAFALLSLVAACGPIDYVNQVTRRANGEVEAAEAVANASSPEYLYWHTLAVEYLRKAREEAALADFQAANRFGRKAEMAAKQARKYALHPTLTAPDGLSRDADEEGGRPASEGKGSPDAQRPDKRNPGDKGFFSPDEEVP